MTQRVLVLVALPIAVLSIQGCSTLSLRAILTRTEQDTYTITTRDTTHQIEYRNAPGQRGIIYPSDRTITATRRVEQYDSTVERHYPNFIRFGVFETVGLLATAPSDRGIGGGIFGIYLDPNEAFSSQIRPKSALFTGSLYRFGILEMPLYWFDDAPTWSVGTSLGEIFQLEADNKRAVVGAFPLYVRKRFYLREEIPYVAVTAAAGFGFLPSQYLNLAGSLDIGSIGGLNIRSYAGLLIARSIEQQSLVQPYLGLGTSVLDFLNHPRELRRQWDEHEHSSWNIGALRITTFLLLSGSPPNSQQPSVGLQLQVAPTTIALPIADNRICAGVDLFNVVYAFRQKQTLRDAIGFGYGVLPLRVGYWLPFGDSRLALESFAMYSYFPHSMWQVAATLRVAALEWLPVGISVGYISSAGFTVNRGTIRDVVDATILGFDIAYLGISIGIAEEIFRPSQLRYNRAVQ
ncbi:MAG: hypothetical protein D6747_03220 [Chlorobiota bacterium]|nr:MAG: hypothetical protein D6747_03220 [Chlorobiota bacterium]